MYSVDGGGGRTVDMYLNLNLFDTRQTPAFAGITSRGVNGEVASGSAPQLPQTGT